MFDSLLRTWPLWVMVFGVIVFAKVCNWYIAYRKRQRRL